MQSGGAKLTKLTHVRVGAAVLRLHRVGSPTPSVRRAAKFTKFTDARLDEILGPLGAFSLHQIDERVEIMSDAALAA